MNKITAIKSASACVSIHGSKTSWTVYAPYYDDNIQGPSGEINADSYRKARAIAAAKKAHIALALMDELNDETKMAVEWAYYNGCNNTADLVAVALAV